MSDRKRVEAEVHEWSQADLGICRDCERGFIAGRTVTDEQVEAAGRTGYEYERAETFYRWPSWDGCPESEREAMRSLIRAAFRAAGLLIEGEDHE